MTDKNIRHARALLDIVLVLVFWAVCRYRDTPESWATGAFTLAALAWVQAQQNRRDIAEGKRRT